MLATQGTLFARPRPLQLFSQLQEVQGIFEGYVIPFSYLFFPNHSQCRVEEWPRIPMCVDTCALEEEKEKYLAKETDQIAASGGGGESARETKKARDSITCQGLPF